MWPGQQLTFWYLEILPQDLDLFRSIILFFIAGLSFNISLMSINGAVSKVYFKTQRGIFIILHSEVKVKLSQSFLAHYSAVKQKGTIMAMT